MARRSNIDGRELLIAAALKLFAEEGIDGVSIRAINREAGLGPASAHYHFGTKEALVEAVLHIHGDQIVDAVTSRAQALVDSESPVTARDLVQMLAVPYIDLIAAHTKTGGGARLPGQHAGTATTSAANVLHVARYPTCPVRGGGLHPGSREGQVGS